jgi:tetratricopeptide (TPR) repeat protein
MKDYDKAREYLKKKDYLLAATCFEKAGRLDKAALYYLKLKDWVKASELYDKLGNRMKSIEIEEKGRKGGYK